MTSARLARNCVNRAVNRAASEGLRTASDQTITVSSPRPSRGAHRPAPSSGVAANLVGLTYIAAGQNRRDDALKLIEEARAIAEASNARGLIRQIDEARAQL
jgi:hypothetical protein